MKKKILLLLCFLSSGLLIGIGLNAIDRPPDPCACKWGYSSTTTWKGNCYGCDCTVFSYTGRDRCSCR